MNANGAPIPVAAISLINSFICTFLLFRIDSVPFRSCTDVVHGPTAMFAFLVDCSKEAVCQAEDKMPHFELFMSILTADSMKYYNYPKSHLMSGHNFLLCHIQVKRLK